MTPIIRILIACEESQAECIAFRELGFDAYSCDIQPCKKGGHPEWHIQGDVTPYLQGCTDFHTQDGSFVHLKRWDLIIAHPPCTYLCKVSSVQLHKDPDFYLTFQGQSYFINGARYQHLKDGRRFFFQCLAANAHYVAVENPIPMRLAQLPRPDAYACPSWYGSKYTKKTLYWLKNLPPLMAEHTHPHPKELVRSSRGKYRSRTYPGLAQAIARQWSAAIIDDITSGRYAAQ